MPIQEVPLKHACEEVYGIGMSWYYELAKQGYVPKVVKGKIPFISATKRIVEYYRNLCDGNQSITLIEERTKLTSKRAEKLALEVMSLKGELVDLDSVEKVVGTVIVAFKARLLSLPAKLAPIVVGTKAAVAQKKILEAIHTVLEEFSQIDYDDLKRRKVDLEKDTKALKTVAKNDSKRVGRRKKNPKPRVKRRTRKVANVKS